MLVLIHKKLFSIKSYLSILLVVVFASCKSEFGANDYTAFFGGEIINPNNKYIVFCKDNIALDTITLDKNNRFLIKFDSLIPGLYSFKHEPEYQYLYFDKNDSIMVRVNTKDFDESLSFCGRGDGKNNYLMEMYLKNEKDKENLFKAFDYDFKKFNAHIEKSYKDNIKLYEKRKCEVEWNEDFDVYANAIVNFPHYTKKEIYPVIHKMRTGKDVLHELPKDYYNFRNTIDYSNESLTDFSPYVMYLNHMLNNLATIHYHNHFTDVDLALKTNINKMKITDTLIKNEKVKNIVLNGIAFQYLLEDQNIVNNKEFLKVYNQYSTDKSQKNEINKIGTAFQQLTEGKTLPNVVLVDINGSPLNSDDIIKNKTVFYFWTESAATHMIEVHKKINQLKKINPSYNYIAVNLNDNENDWKKTVLKNKFDTTKEYRAVNFNDVKNKWAITKVHRTIVVNGDKTIRNAFTNVFDLRFKEELK